MTKRCVITVPQLFTMLFISRTIINITYNPFMASDGNMIDHVLSALLAYVLTFLLVMPVYFVYRSYPEGNLADYSYYLLGKCAVVVVGIYVLYYLLVCCYTLSLFELFVTNVMSPKIPLVVLSAAIVLTSCYGAWKGIEGLARASGIILLLICIALIFLVCALFSDIDPVVYPPLLYEGPSTMLSGAMLMIARTTCIPAMAMLLSLAKGNVKRGIFVWNTATYLVIIGMVLVIVGCLGDYLKTQVFPVYAVTSIAEIGMLKRLDSLFLGIWTTGLFVKIALFLYLICLCVTRMFGRKAGRIAILIAGAITAAVSILIVEWRELSRLAYDWRFLLPCTLTVSLVLPLFLLVVGAVKKRRKRRVLDA